MMMKMMMVIMMMRMMMMMMLMCWFSLFDLDHKVLGWRWVERDRDICARVDGGAYGLCIKD